MYEELEVFPLNVFSIRLSRPHSAVDFGELDINIGFEWARERERNREKERERERERALFYQYYTV